MNKVIKSLSVIATVCLITACGPSGGGATGVAPASATPVNSNNQRVTSTSDLVASPDFNFRNDRDISINFSDFPSEVGKFVVYHAYEHYEPETKTYYPDHTSRIASYVANTEITYTIQSLKEWQYLIFEWLPMDGNSHEQYMLVALSDENDYTLSF